jgi:hypothetical protein
VNITGLTEDTAPDLTNDFLMIYKTSAGANRKLKPTNLSGVANDIINSTNVSKLTSVQSIIDYLGYTIKEGENLLRRASTITYSYTSGYTKVKDFDVNIAGTYTVRFTYAKQLSGTGTVKARIYKNGVAYS